jgi:anthranilate phosphoribosyltransferase
LDEISVSAPTKVTELKDNEIRTYELTPDDLGLRTYTLQEVIGGDAAENAAIIHRILAGEKGAHRDIVLANAGACFYVTGQCATLQEAVKFAGSVIDSGKAADKLKELVHFTGDLSHVS